jgi:hypothetical protein
LQDQYAQELTDPYDILEESYIMKVKEAFVGVEAPTTTVVVEEFAPIPPTPAPVSTTTPTAEPTLVAPPKPKLVEKPKPKQKIVPEEEKMIIEPLTPDRHAGRRFTSLLPEQGTIILPIRGEKTLRPAVVEVPTGSNAVEKAQQLQTYIDEIRKTERTQQKPEMEQIITQLMAQNEELLKQIATLKNQPSKQREVKDLEQQQKDTVETIAKLKEQISTLSTKVGVIPPSLQPTKPNTVSGIVRNIQGQGIGGVLLVIKNDKNEPVRAIKANELGEFEITNPLINGQYKMEADVNGATGFHFDIIEFEAKGEIIPAMEFVGQ